MVLTSAKGARTVRAETFFQSFFTTALEANEILTEVRFPAPPKDTGWSVLEISRRHGDFAIAGIVAGLSLESNRQEIAQARLVYFGVGPTPIRVKAAEDALVGQAAAEAAFEAAAQSAKQNIDPSNDIHATEEYRRAVAATLTKRALRAALQKLGNN